MEEKYIILCLQNGENKDAMVQLIENDEKYSVEIKVSVGDLRIEKEAENYFEALIEIRRELEKENIKLLCKGCCKNVYPSAMLLSMGTGRKAYVLTRGKQAKMDSLVDIFAPCSSEEYATISEQEIYYNNWIDTLRR